MQFMVNLEVGSERCVLDGDATSEVMLVKMSGFSPRPGQRDLMVESMYEYGSRAGVWRVDIAHHWLRHHPLPRVRLGLIRHRSLDSLRSPFVSLGKSAAGEMPADTCIADALFASTREALRRARQEKSNNKDFAILNQMPFLFRVKDEVETYIWGHQAIVHVAKESVFGKTQAFAGSFVIDD
ncbi:MAG: hypothetical protein HC826_00150 [Rhodospirillales bacterium]|nr:hypothetical protein [Rhodospirillales bacterium]